MRKLLISLVSALTLVLNVTTAFASGSGSAYGDGFTLNGYICDSYISGIATGASDINVQLYDMYYYNKSGSAVPRTGSRSGTTYVYYYGSEIGSNFSAWKQCTIMGVSSSGQSAGPISITNHRY